MSLTTEPDWIFPFENMEIGDSFFIPTLKPSPIMYAADCGAKRVGMKVKCYVSTKEGHLGIRVWRIG